MQESQVELSDNTCTIGVGAHRCLLGKDGKRKTVRHVPNALAWKCNAQFACQKLAAKNVLLHKCQMALWHSALWHHSTTALCAGKFLMEGHKFEPKRSKDSVNGHCRASPPAGSVHFDCASPAQHMLCCSQSANLNGR